MITDVLTQPDAALEGSLRPGVFADFTGQLKVKERLGIAVEAAKQRGEALDHILLSGPPGLGKTTLAGILAREMGGDMKVTSGPIIEKAADLAGLLTNLNQGDVLFIDEIHRLQKNIEEYLYPAMEDFTLDIIIDQGPSARSVRLNLPKFTLIGATTRSGLLTAPLLTRFPVRLVEVTPREKSCGHPSQFAHVAVGVGAAYRGVLCHACTMKDGGAVDVPAVVRAVDAVLAVARANVPPPPRSTPRLPHS